MTTKKTTTRKPAKKTTSGTAKGRKPTTKRKPRTAAKGKKTAKKKPVDMGPQDASYRVFVINQDLKAEIQALNNVTPDSTLQSTFEDAVTTHLDNIVERLLEQGVMNGGRRKPIRVRISDRTLAALASASQRTGIDQRALLCCCLHRAVK